MPSDPELGLLLRELVGEVSDSFVLVDRAHRVLFASGAGYGDALGPREGSVLEGFLGEGREAVERVFGAGRSTAFETDISTPSGPRRIETRVIPLGGDAEVRYAGLLSRDVTAEHQQKLEAARGHALLSALERVNRVMLGSLDADQVFDRVLDEVLDVFDCDRAWLSYPCDPDAPNVGVVHERTRPGFSGAGAASFPADEGMRKRMRAALAQPGVPVRSDPACDPVGPLDQANASVQVKSVLCAALCPSTGKPWLFGIHHCRAARVYEDDVPIFAAVTARLLDGLNAWLSQRELRDSEARFRLLVQHAPEAIVMVDMDSRKLVEVNEQAAKLFGYTREELLGRTPLDLSPPVQADGRSTVERSAELAERAARGELTMFEWLHQNARGELLECEVRLLPLPHAEHRWLRGSILHIADRKRIERENEQLAKQLLHAQKMQVIGQLTGGVAHDFNNLLMVINSSLEVIESHADDRARVLEFAELSRQGCARAAELTHRLQAFAREQPLRPQVVDLATRVSSIERLLRRSLGENIAIITWTSPGLWPCEVDPGQLENALLNLAINARDAMPDGGKLSIDLRNTQVRKDGAQDELRPGDYVLMTVSDTGHGVASDVLAKVFEPFFTTKDVGKGSGLGLSMVYGFAAQSGGHVAITSEVGHGTSVRLFLPRSLGGAQATTTRDSEEPLPRGRGQLLLVVEDEPSVRLLVVELLRQLGYRVLEAGTGAEALRVIEREPQIALLVSDMLLPGGMTGAQLAARARVLHPRLPTLYMSGYMQDHIVREGRLDPDAHLLEKPFSSAALARAVHALLERPSSQRA